MRDEWYVARRGQDGNKRYGPVPLRQLRELVDVGKVKPEDLVWREGMDNWQRADQCEEIAPPPPRRDSRRDPRDYAPDERRDYDRGPRGYRPEDDDRPYRRRYPPPRKSSSGWVVPLVVGGVLVALCFLGCAGLVGYAMFDTPSSPTFAPVAVTTFPTPTPPRENQAQGEIFNPPIDNNPAVGFEHQLAYGNNSQLYYSDNVTEDEAQDLGERLSSQNVFPDDRGITVQLDKSGDTYLVRFCVKQGMEWTDEATTYYGNIRTDIVNNVFANVEVDLCDANMNTLRRIGP